MTDIKQQIFKELTALEDAVSKLNGVAAHSARQNDLEIAILSEQVKVLREKNSNAANFVDKSISILKNLK